MMKLTSMHIKQTVCSAIKSGKAHRVRIRSLLLVAIAFMALTVSPSIIGNTAAHADTNCSPNGVVSGGSGSSWLNGGGVNVCAEPGDGSHDCVYVSGAPGGSGCSANYVYSGDEWQCVELVNRLYLTKGWTTATWFGNGNTLINNLPSNLTDQLNGSISYVNSGDVITLNNINNPNGHGAVINTVGSSLGVINQNAGLNSTASLTSGSLGSGNAAYTMNGWSGFSVQAIVHHPVTVTNPSKVVGDWDGDGKTNLTVFRPSDGTWHWRTNAGGDNSQQFGESGDIPVPAWYSSDGKLDYAVFRPSNSTWYVLPQGGSQSVQSFGSSGDIPVPGDYDGVGHTQYAVFRPSNVTWYWLSSSGTSSQSFGSTGDIPVPAVWDGGTKTEPGVFRPSTGTWYYLTPNGTVSQSYGSSGDDPEPAYYSGSTKPDYGLFRPSNSTWYWFRQGDSGGNSQGFGQSGDIPMPGNYSGATKTDFGVYRPSNGTWYWLPQGGSQNSQSYGQSTDIPAVTVLPYPILHSLGLL